VNGLRQRVCGENGWQAVACSLSRPAGARPIANKFDYSFRDRLAQRDACDEVSVAIEMHAFGRGMGEVMVSQNRLVTNGQIACIRLTNSGPDSIWLDDSNFSFKTEFEEGLLSKADENGWQTVGGIGLISASHSQRIRLRLGESKSFIVPVDHDARAIQLGVDIADRRDQRKKEFWSPSFPVPDDLFNFLPD
jgi:hypothetical protein